MRCLLPALSVLLAACGARPAGVIHPVVRPISTPFEQTDVGVRTDSEPDLKPPIPSCAGSGGADARPASADARELAAARALAPDRWNKGFRALRPPRGFHILPAARNTAVADLITTFVHHHEEFEVTVQIFDHPAAPAQGASLLRHVVRAFDGNGEDLDDDIDDASLTGWFNRVSELRDEESRRIVEWAFVQKGCERSELYERFVEDGDHLWHIRMEISPTAPEADLLLWMALFFDAPLAGPAPPDRGGLAGQNTPR